MTPPPINSPPFAFTPSRAPRLSLQVDPAKKCAAVVLAGDATTRAALAKERATVALLGRIDDTLLSFPDDPAAAAAAGGRGKAVHLVPAPCVCFACLRLVCLAVCAPPCALHPREREKRERERGRTGLKASFELFAPPCPQPCPRQICKLPPSTFWGASASASPSPPHRSYPPTLPAPRAPSGPQVVSEGLECDLPMDQLVDAAKERKRLAKQRAALEKDSAGLERRLTSSGFLAKASPAVVAETTAALADKKEALAGVLRSLADLE